MAVRAEFSQTLNMLRDEEVPLSRRQLFHLSSPTRGDMLAFAHYWEHIAVDRRRRVIQLLNEMAEENFEMDFRGIFRFCLEDPDADIRAVAIDGLWEDEDVSLIAPLVHLLQDDLSSRVRASAASALGKYLLMGELDRLEEGHATFVRQALIGVIRQRDEDLDVRRRAVESVSYTGSEEIRRIIEAAYYAPEEEMRASAVFAMGRSADPRWRGTVLKELGSPTPEIRFEAARASGELEDPRAVPHLIRLLDDPDREVQAVAIWALGQVGGPAARQALEWCCESEDDVVRDTAEDALAELEFNSGTGSLLLYDIQPKNRNGHGAAGPDDLDGNGSDEDQSAAHVELGLDDESYEESEEDEDLAPGDELSVEDDDDLFGDFEDWEEDEDSLDDEFEE